MTSNHITPIDTDAPSPALLAYWETPEFKAYLQAKQVWECAHANYVAISGYSPEKTLAREYLNLCADEARYRLAICRALPIHLEAFGW